MVCFIIKININKIFSLLLKDRHASVIIQIKIKQYFDGKQTVEEEMQKKEKHISSVYVSNKYHSRHDLEAQSN